MVQMRGADEMTTEAYATRCKPAASLGSALGNIGSPVTATLGITKSVRSAAVSLIFRKIGPVVEYAMQELCQSGWLKPASCPVSKIRYEEEDQGSDWFLFMYHHMFISYSPSSS